jgi:tRNA threonylcarbamoyl adenosine modification protein YeaZ
MISLFLDTCNHNIIIGLLENNKLIYSTSFINDNNLSEKLLPTIKLSLEKINKKVENINRIYISIGPGSFTGIRIGVTVAKTMAWALNIEIIPISSLEVIASTSTSKDYLCSLIDARRGYVYAGIYDKNLNAVFADKYLKFEELINVIDNKFNNTEFVGYERLNDKIIEPSINIEKVVEKHINDNSINPHSINPIYLKKTEAEEKNDRANN